MAHGALRNHTADDSRVFIPRGHPDACHADTAGLVATAAALTAQPVAARALVWVDWLTVAGGVAVAAAVWSAIHGLAAAVRRVPVLGGAR
jgi:hypothetical protein